MKHFRHIQNLFLFFTLFFLMSGIGLILAFRHNLYAVGAVSLSTLAGVWLMIRALLTLRGYFHAFKQREARLVLLASRDPATGLFERNGFEALLSQEIERAKRRDYTLTLVLIQVEPLAQIQNDIGATACDRLMFQIGESLQKHCRHYDSAFKIDAATFALYFSETHVEELGHIIKRLQKRLQSTAFLVNAERVKITPVFKLGAAIYPLDGTNPQMLETFARSHLSETFELTKLRHPEKPRAEFDALPAEPTAPLVDDTPLMIESEKTEMPITASKPRSDSDFTPDFSKIQTETLKGTPEMTAFVGELSALFARTDSLEQNIKKLLTDEKPILHPEPVQAVAEAAAANTPPREEEKLQTLQQSPVVETKPAAVTLPDITPPAKTKTTAPERVTRLRPVKSPEPLPLTRQPLPGQQYFQKPISPPHTQNKTTDLGPAPALPATANAWSAEELADMPDVVAALMQNEISRL